ncbi:hypothetical protein [Streptomyces sp. NPDC059949]|uniref:hypothetical protein n=1 Tax=Streptomyces sp. NPDC059949 TaxID=3347013 RepID=UPI003647DD9B
MTRCRMTRCRLNRCRLTRCRLTRCRLTRWQRRGKPCWSVWRTSVAGWCWCRWTLGAVSGRPSSAGWTGSARSPTRRRSAGSPRRGARATGSGRTGGWSVRGCSTRWCLPSTSRAGSRGTRRGRTG